MDFEDDNELGAIMGLFNRTAATTTTPRTGGWLSKIATTSTTPRTGGWLSKIATTSTTPRTTSRTTVRTTARTTPRTGWLSRAKQLSQRASASVPSRRRVKRVSTIRRPVRAIRVIKSIKTSPTTKPGESSRAYRHLCANAGVGGAAAESVLKQILQLVRLQDTRVLATSEHHMLNNTQAFRREVLKRLSGKLRRKRGK